jgi:hypothetical protein
MVAVETKGHGDPVGIVEHEQEERDGDDLHKIPGADTEDETRNNRVVSWKLRCISRKVFRDLRRKGNKYSIVIDWHPK